MDAYGTQKFPGRADATQMASPQRVLLPLLMATPMLLTGYICDRSTVAMRQINTPSSVSQILSETGKSLRKRDLTQLERDAMWRALRRSAEIVDQGRLVS